MSKLCFIPTRHDLSPYLLILFFFRFWYNGIVAVIPLSLDVCCCCFVPAPGTEFNVAIVTWSLDCHVNYVMGIKTVEFWMGLSGRRCGHFHTIIIRFHFNWFVETQDKFLFDNWWMGVLECETSDQPTMLKGLQCDSIESVNIKYELISPSRFARLHH